MKRLTFFSVVLASLITADGGAWAASVTTLANFDGGATGERAYGNMILSGNMLYGETEGANNGAVYSVPVSGGSPTTLAYFIGYTTSGLLVQSGGKLYGTAYDDVYGGGYNSIVYSVPITGGTPTILASLTNSLVESGVVLNGGTLYITAANGAAKGLGTVFSLPIGGGSPTTLATFNGTNGQEPVNGLILSGGTLYGTTEYGGANNQGTVYSVPISGGTITNLGSFGAASTQIYPSGLTLVGGVLYGTTAAGGDTSLNNGWGFGSLFSVPVAGGTVSTLVSFGSGSSSGSGVFPSGSLIPLGGTLYGSTGNGVSNGRGTIYSMPLGGGQVNTLISFDGTDGQYDALDAADADGNLYGTTTYGGLYGYGTVFEFSTTPEPASLSLLGVGGVSLLLRRRR